MEKLIEIIRRLAVVIVWAVGGGLCLIGLGEYNKGNINGVRDETDLIIPVAVLVVTYIVHKLVNWILLKNEKKPTSVN